MRTTAGALLIVTMLLAVTGACAGIAPWPDAGDFSSELDLNNLSSYSPSVTTASYPLTSATRVKNVILCIGDGMGLNQVALASMKATGLGGKLYMERLPVAGLARTHSDDSRVTDSAAAATALATGIKTKNGMIGVAPQEQAYCTLLEAAQAKGMATGLVATSMITHATPASFAAHVKSRKMEDKIAEHLLANRVNVLFGGGRKFFLPQSDPNSGRKDDLNLIIKAKEAGYEYIETLSELRSVRSAHVLGLFQLDALTTAAPEPSLALLTRKAIQVLRRARTKSTGKKPGFFLMVEGSQIDWACHDNDASAAVRQTLLFDQAVEAVVDFALRDGRTLVVVTADHETGGLTLSEDNDTVKAHWSTRGHSASPVPVWALGPEARRFAGVQDNTEIARKITQALNIRPFPRPMK